MVFDRKGMESERIFGEVLDKASRWVDGCQVLLDWISLEGEYISALSGRYFILRWTWFRLSWKGLHIMVDGMTRELFAFPR
jgi:hypothetical protein